LCPVISTKDKLAKASYEHLSSLDLADTSTCSSEMPINSLSGNDFYWQFIIGETRTGQRCGPVATKMYFVFGVVLVMATPPITANIG